MTLNQRARFFMPAWNRLCHTYRWHTQAGKAALEVIPEADEMQKAIIHATRMAGFPNPHSAIRNPQFTLSELRHALYIVVLGRDKDTDDLNNGEVDRIVALFDYLRGLGTNDLGAMANWQAYQRGENPGAKVRRRHVIRSRAPEAIQRKLARDLSGGRTSDPDSLTDSEEYNMARMLKQRPVYGHKPELRNAERGVRNYKLDPHKKFEPQPEPQPALLF